MVFSSIIFLIYFLPVFLLAYALTPLRWRNITILLTSVFFYSWGAPKFIFVLLFTTYLDYWLVRWMDVSKNDFRRKIFLFISVSVNVGLLFYFKYSNFFIENLNAVFSIVGVHPIGWMKLILPIGISFYTFETITYVVDVYRRVHKPLHNFWDYQTYILLFPKLIAGPIIRYNELADQIENRKRKVLPEQLFHGAFLFVIGLIKKVILANHIGYYADKIFTQNFHSLSATDAWLGILSYTFQIYFDFSGYSDMAIGLGKMMGFRFPENFNQPYTAGSITEFWRRWHISLGNWMRNYLYIPLGGNRVKSSARLYFNLLLVFLASGLWHGAAWGFIIWGLYHGLFLIADRIFLVKILNQVGKYVAAVFTFFIVAIGWVFFRLEHWHNSIQFIYQLFSFNQTSFKIQQLFIDKEFYTYFTLCLLFSFFVLFPKGKTVQQYFYAETIDWKSISWFQAISIALITGFLLCICIAMITASDFNPFIYFRF